MSTATIDHRHTELVHVGLGNDGLTDDERKQRAVIWERTQGAPASREEIDAVLAMFALDGDSPLA